MDARAEWESLCLRHLDWKPPSTLLRQPLHRIQEAVSATHGRTFPGLLFGSEHAIARQYIVEEDIEPFVRDAPDGYFLTGFWGYGVNSEAFYYSHVDQRLRVLFRVPFGNVYTGGRDEAADVRRVLDSWIAFLKSVDSEISSVLAVDSMGAASYEIRYTDGVTRRWPQGHLGGSLVRDPDFFRVLGRPNPNE